MNQLMKRTVLLLGLATVLLLSACGNESKLPNATGKASITAINAIYGSPALSFSIEQLPVGTIAYQDSIAAISYDDLDYTFNFDTHYAGDSERTRLASQHIDMIADQHYTILMTGTLEATILTVWEVPQRDFVDTDSVFQARFSHTSDQLGAAVIDVYFALDGVAPVLGEQVATLAFGDISDALEFGTDDYVVTITTSGDPADILFTSRPTTVPSHADVIITPFDGDANNTTPLVVRGLNTLGNPIPFHDSAALSTVQFLHAAMEMGTTDVFDDAALSSQILSGHAYRDLTSDAPVATGDYEYFYTPVGDTSIVSLETAFTAAESRHHRVTAIGTGGSYIAFNTLLDRRSVNTAAKLVYFQASNNFEATDLYVVDAGTTITDKAPLRSRIASKVPNATIELAPGSYDLYVTNYQDKEIIAGPFRLDVDFGDVVDMVVFDTSDPAVLDIAVYPIP